ncbi:MAG: dihydroorotase [Bacteroidetes bacterium]|nr:dihydroorotase [Bacteroidota bacterium]
MTILIQKAQIIDSKSLHNGQIRDILIENGHIKAIGSELPAQADKIVHQPGLVVSPGWVDIFSHFNDPGYEYKETLTTGAAAAAAGGYTDVFVLPNTKPVVDSKSQVEYIRGGSSSLPVNVWPLGAVTRGLEGKDLAEMYDMRNSGAVAFSDGTSPVQSAGLLLKGLQYVKAFGGTIIQIPDDKTVGANGLMNEGIVSTRLGLPGKPMMAEELMVARDIKLVRYTESRLHFTGISSPKSLEYVRRAKESGLAVSCSVTPYHLFFTDAELVNYDTNLKVYPPLRDASSMEALRKAVKDGLVDCIASHHLPHEFDSKVLEFEYARSGMIGLETAYAVVRTAIPELTSEQTVSLFSTKPRELFGLEQPLIGEGAKAVLTLFQPDGTTRLEEKGTKSKSKNSAFFGTELKGRVLGIVNGTAIQLNESAS